MKHKLVTLVLAMVVIVSIVVVGCAKPAPAPAPAPAPTPAPAPAPAPEVKTLQIGQLVALTGWFAEAYDIRSARETAMMAEIINDKGGITINGQRYNIEIVNEDIKSTLDGTATAANRLVYDKQVKFVVGPMGFFSDASSPVFEENKVLHVSTWVTAKPGELDETTPYGFLGHNSCLGCAQGALRAIKKEFPTVRTLLLGAPDDGAPPYFIPKVKRLIELEGGFEVVGETVLWPNEMLDFTPISAKVNSIEGADAMLQINGPEFQIAGITKGLRELGNYMPWIKFAPEYCGEIMDIAGKPASTNIMTAGYTPGAPGNPPLMDELYNRLAVRYGPGKLNLFNPNSLYVLVNVIEAAQSLDPTVVKAKWESMDTVDTLYGEAVICGDEMYGIKHHAIIHPLPIQKLMDGEIVFGGWIDVPPLP